MGPQGFYQVTKSIDETSQLIFRSPEMCAHHTSSTSKRDPGIQIVPCSDPRSSQPCRTLVFLKVAINTTTKYDIANANQLWELSLRTSCS